MCVCVGVLVFVCVAQAPPRPDSVLQCVADVALSAGAGQPRFTSLCAPLCPLPAGNDTGQEPQP